jgi:phosphotriesterase-related protein
MAKVNTVLGEVDSNDLGTCYMHEHIFIVNPEIQYYWPGYNGWDEDEYVEKGRVALKRLHDEYGVDTILDPTVAGLGRNVRAIARALEGTGLNVVICTGWYTYDVLPFTFFGKDVAGKTDELERMFMHDWENGLDGTSIKPGAIKCSTDRHGVTPDIEALLRASARVHKRTGMPIITHSEYTNECGRDQQKLFMEEGVDMEAVLIGHVNQSNSLDYMESLISNGSYIGFDRCGIESPVADFDTQISNLAELCRRGYAKNVMLSHDNMVFMDLAPPEMLGRLREHFPYGFIHNRTLPALREKGVSEEDINTMLVENPRNYFSRADKK